ncbi:hypothetical protein TARUN_7004 [Trichoderma arundinaceum]|uniref:Uncharacterized protein n=1 Tax=Trichoderma arundinaceum TaxID=490622 RepID=A0A395NHB6_TRIAR|nr:hypothetical protein TARUN_7004 [Trichoderma arundinaceum]
MGRTRPKRDGAKHLASAPKEAKAHAITDRDMAQEGLAEGEGVSVSVMLPSRCPGEIATAMQAKTRILDCEWLKCWVGVDKMCDERRRGADASGTYSSSSAAMA